MSGDQLRPATTQSRNLQILGTNDFVTSVAALPASILTGELWCVCPS